VSVPELDSHLATCASCRAAVATERARLNRIDSELEESLAVRPSPAFLPAVRRRVAELSTKRQAPHRWWPAPVLATLAGVLVVGHLLRHTVPDPASPASDGARPAERPPAHVVESLEPMTARASEVVPSSSPRAVAAHDTGRTTAPDRRQEAAETPLLRRVFVPAEDAETVRRLARRLRGHAARAAVLGPEVQKPFDFALKPIEDGQEVVTIDHRVPRGLELHLEEPSSFDLTVEKAGRET
jgi:hypothetical protein